ncbi:MAG TPA: GNAT family N-acetyltransferase [Mycobacteriales bacterium]|nr:GNAT family N-acetyltransferase [Mycobacteriales bacterium]
MQVRSADVDDVPQLAALRAQWREQESSAQFVAAYRDWFVREAAVRWWWLAVDGPAAIGMVNLKMFDRMPSPGRPPSRWGYLANLYVVPEHRDAGVGTALLTALVDRARAEGLVRIVLSPSEQAAPLYARFGFRPATDLMLLPLENG